MSQLSGLGFLDVGELFGDAAQAAVDTVVNPTQEEAGYYDGYANALANPQTLPGTYTPMQVYNPVTGQYQQAAAGTAQPVIKTQAATATPTTTNKLKEWFDKNKTLVLIGGAALIGLIIFMNMKK